MTDLENLWDDYPTGKAPVTAILAAAVGERRRRRRLLVRPLLTAGVATGVAGAFVAGTLVGGSGPGTPGGTALPERVAFKADLEPAASCDELLASYVRRGKERVTAWGWDDFRVALGAHGREGPVADRAVNKLSGRTAGQVPKAQRATSSDTGTNVQEAGVDEPDTVKTDGSVLVTVRDDDLVTWDVTGASTERLSSVRLDGIESAELLLAGDTVVAIGADAGAPPEAPGTRVLTISLADPAEPEVVADVSYDAALLSARQHGDTVRLVLESGLPDLDFVEPRGRRTDQAALRRNRQVVEESTIEDWLPTITTDGDSRQLLDCTDVAIPSDDLGLATTSIVGLDLTSTAEPDAIGLAGRTGIAYESADHLYLATRAGWDGWDGSCLDWCRGAPTRTSGTTHVFDFELDGSAATHVASGEVEGAVRDRWSVDEADGVLRLALGPTSETGDFNSVVTLRREGEQLVEHGRLDRLGPREDITSVRWFDDLAIVVTFRRVDPLYAVDLTDSSRPRLLGKLKVPGFSSYLHPLGSWRMVGVGEGPDGKGGWGAQVGLFDVRDITDVRRLDVHSYGRSFRALAGTDPRAFTWLPDERTVVTVLERRARTRVGYVSIIRLVDGELRQRLQQVEYGADVDLVRAVPLPDGRVVLATGEQAQFLEL
ncbi:beta propeller domain-containing protein [Nocardioides sp. J9]|uniref:beta-propeller domain-containing protein n=1 Tax=Nocardioides sp. J9 TaxID=935844 RepID=UPI0011A66E7C|nr:beta-propeller domain-containing protein [Nocardioides sp. J9]TWH01941.1 beta propeller domain-containing protein [Nocardioides sp. J9]